jgi:hypothetical protein
MDPYTYAQQQGQVIASQPGDADPLNGYEPEDLLDLLLYAFAQAGRLAALDRPGKQAVGDFAAFANDWLTRNRVVSTGIVDGEFALVFEDGTTVPLASQPEGKPQARPDPAIPLTLPRESKMRGMPVVDTSTPITGTRSGPGRGKLR